MCIVIDTNVLSMVFNDQNSRHSEFVLIKEWVEKRNGYVVYGGTKYKAELALAPRYLRLLRILRDAGKAICIRDEAVDALERTIHMNTIGTSCVNCPQFTRHL
jgi:hypothetical protein